ncbi:MAG: glycoside hydrolase family 125 protein, partial [Pseudonocardiaceae bacterium]
LTGSVPPLAPDVYAPGQPRWSGADSTGAYEVESWAAPDHPAVVQRHTVRTGGDLGPRKVTLVVSGRLEQPPFAEITEVSPLPAIPGLPVTTAEGTTLRVAEPSLPAVALLRVTVSCGSTTGWRTASDGAELSVTWDPARDPVLVLTVTCALAQCAPPVPDDPAPGTSPMWRWGHAAGLHVPARLRPDLERLVAGTLHYVLGCTALIVAPDERCILTDHRLLPLSWTRDAYYQALLLLAACHREPSTRAVVADHLRWLWGRCDRGDHGWMRSHLPNGAVKDRAYQADQQLYPVLELLDYRGAAGRFPTPPSGVPSWGALVAETWRALPVDPELGLVAGEENAADDPACMPYQLSSQILLWHTATRLAEWECELDLCGLGLAEHADTVLASIRDRFTCPGPFGTQWAYETDGDGRHRLYHDANDLPTVLAPLWGLCSAEDVEWTATMRFAFGPSNAGWSDGRWGGLGSAHTAGTWPLGDVQEWVVASLQGHADRAERVLRRLLAVAAPDGLLPETHDPDTGAWLARHWFAWPSAALGALALGAVDRAVPEAGP